MQVHFIKHYCTERIFELCFIDKSYIFAFEGHLRNTEQSSCVVNDRVTTKQKCIMKQLNVAHVFYVIKNRIHHTIFAQLVLCINAMT